MSECTFKAPGWLPQGKPVEGPELADSRQLIREIIFSLHRQKSDILGKMGMPSQPVSLRQIYLEICSRIAMLRDCRRWPYRVHEKRWWDRRCNEEACAKYAINGAPKIIAVTAGYYAPSPTLFEKSLLEASV